MLAKEGFSEVDDGLIEGEVFFVVFVFLENMSSSNLATALAVSISPIVNIFY